MATRSPLETVPAALAAFEAAENAWSAALVKAFGKDACNRRYDVDITGHPPECVRLMDKRQAAMRAWQKALDEARAARA
jgi:hypothetical protein